MNKHKGGRFKNGKCRTDILNDPRNKVRVPGHKGPHPEEMHQKIYTILSNASKKGDAAFFEALADLKVLAVTKGSWLNKYLVK